MLYEYLEKNNLGRYLDRRLVLLTDVFMVVLASLSSILFMAVLTFCQYTIKEVTLWMSCSVFFALLSFLFFGTHKSIVRNSSLYEAWSLLRAVLLKGVLMLGFVQFLCWYHRFSFPHFFALLFMDCASSYLGLMLDRIVVVVAYDIVRQQNRKRRSAVTVMVYGVHEDSYAFVQSQGSNYNVVGYLKRGKSRRKYRLGEHRVYEFHDETRLMQVLDMNSVDAIVFTSQADINKEEQMLLPCCRTHNVKTMFAPPVSELKREGKKTPGTPHEIRIEDVLGRQEVNIDMRAVSDAFCGKTVLVTGSAGSIGSELCRQLAGLGIERLVSFDNAESPTHNLRLELQDSYPSLSFVPLIGDTRSVGTLEKVFSDYRPDVVFHAAAYKHVPLMEENPHEAVAVNVLGTRNVADMCVKYGVGKMVMISTDKAVNPTNVMGCTKRIAEIYVQSLAHELECGRIQGVTQFVTTRFGNVLGSSGSVIPRFTEQIAKGGPVTVTHPDIARFFMTIPEACRLVMEASALNETNKILVFDMGQRVKIASLAERMIELAGFTPGKDIKIEFTGLRPGEKLYEEVLADEENTVSTNHKSIRIAKVRNYEFAQVADSFQRLERLCRDYDILGMVKEMKTLVPEYRSKNSEYEKLDVPAYGTLQVSDGGHEE